MAKTKSVWGIDIGQMALKALKLRYVDGQLYVEAFDVIEHAKMLCQDDADADQLVQNALAQFLARNNVSGSTIVMSMPGRSSFTRFVKLPPVEKSKIPDIVQFEAGQQIPFPIPEVVWRYQMFEDPDSPDVEVGLFAVKRADVFESLAHFTMAGVPVDIVQMAPLALYNFVVHDEQLAPDGATILADVGVDKTDLIVADGPRIWMRTIQIGGKNFTQALEKTFKLSFAKAEKLKRTAAANKYARQVFQAMRPVFSDLVQEIQRSIGYYTQKNRDTKFTRLLGLGNGFRMPGLQKFLERNLGIPVARIDNYNRLSPSPNVNMPVFTDNVLSFAVAYGLALQGLDLAQIATNLLPREIARKRCWDKKRLWFAGAAAAVLLAAATPMYRAAADRKTFESNTSGLTKAGQIVREIEDDGGTYSRLDRDTKEVLIEAETYVGMYGCRSFWPNVQGLISSAVAHATRDHGPLLADDKGRAELRTIARSRRRLIFVESMTSEYFADLAAAAAGEPGSGEYAPAGGIGSYEQSSPLAAEALGRGFRIVLQVRTPMNEKDAASKLMKPLVDYIRKNADSKRKNDQGLPDVFKVASVAWTTSGEISEATDRMGGAVRSGRGPLRGRPLPPGLGRGGGAVEPEAGPENPSALFPDEDISKDTRFTITLLVEITGDGTDSLKPKAG